MFFHVIKNLLQTESFCLLLSLNNLCFPGCTPTFIYMITRHGARYPHRANYEAQQKLFEYTKMINSSRKAKLCDKDLEVMNERLQMCDLVPRFLVTEYIILSWGKTIFQFKSPLDLDLKRIIKDYVDNLL